MFAGLTFVGIALMLMLYMEIRRPRPRRPAQVAEDELRQRLERLTYQNRRLWEQHEDAIRFAVEYAMGTEDDVTRCLALWRQKVAKESTRRTPVPKGMPRE